MEPENAALESVHLGEDRTLDLKPRKSILKLRENSTVPLATSTQEPQIRFDRRVSFANKVQLHKIGFSPAAGRSAAGSSDASEADSSDVENVSPEKYPRQTSERSDGAENEVASLEGKPNGAETGQASHEAVPELSDSEDEEYADADEKTMEFTGQMSLPGGHLGQKSSENSPLQPTGSFQLQVSESSSEADTHPADGEGNQFDNSEEEMELTGQLTRVHQEELTMEFTIVQATSVSQEPQPEQPQRAPEQLEQLEKQDSEQSQKQDPEQSEKQDSEQPEKQPSEQPEKQSVEQPEKQPSEQPHEPEQSRHPDSEQSKQPHEPEHSEQPKTPEQLQPQLLEQLEEHNQSQEQQPQDSQMEETMELTEQIKVTETLNASLDDATMDFTEPVSAPPVDNLSEKTAQSDDDDPDDSTYRDLFLEEAPMELTQTIPAIAVSEKSAAEDGADDTCDRIQIPIITPNKLSDNEDRETPTESEETRPGPEPAETSRVKDIANGKFDEDEMDSEDSDRGRKRELGPAIDFSPPKRHRFVTHVSTSTVPLADVSTTSVDEKEGEWDFPNVSLTEFLSEIGIKFYDDLEIATDLPSRFRPSESDGDESYPKEDYYRANIHLPLLEVNELCCKELSGKIQQGKHLFDELKEKTFQDNPMSFKQYFAAPFYEKMAMKSKFHLMKEYTRQQAKQVWYEWRIKLIGNIFEVFQSNLEILKGDKAVLEDNIQLLNRSFKSVRKRLTTLRKDIASFNEIKTNFEDLDVEQIRTIKSRLTELNQELIKHKGLIAHKEEQVKAIDNATAQRKEVVNRLKKEISDAEEKLNKTRHFDTGEIKGLEFISRALQVCAGLKYVGNPEPTVYEFQFNAQTGITIDSSKAESADGIAFHLLKSDANVLHNNEISRTYCQYLAETTSFVNVFDTLRTFREKWMNLVALDAEIYRLSLLHPVQIDISDMDVLAFTVSFFDFSSKTKAKYTVEVDMKHILAFPTCISVKAHVLRGTASALDKAFSGTILSHAKHQSSTR